MMHEPIHDNLTYVIAALVGADLATGWVKWLPEPNLPNAVYIVTLIWLGIQIYYKLRGKDNGND
jgi:hypothetical protein